MPFDPFPDFDKVLEGRRAKAAPVAKPTAAPAKEPPHPVMAEIARMVAPAVGAVGSSLLAGPEVAPFGAAAASAAAEIPIEKYLEGRDPSLGEAAFQGALSGAAMGVMGEAAGTVGRNIVRRGIQGSIYSAADKAGLDAIRGNQLDPSGIAKAAGVGGLTGGVVGAAEIPVGRFLSKLWPGDKAALHEPDPEIEKRIRLDENGIPTEMGSAKGDRPYKGAHVVTDEEVHAQIADEGPPGPNETPQAQAARVREHLQTVYNDKAIIQEVAKRKAARVAAKGSPIPLRPMQRLVNGLKEIDAPPKTPDQWVPISQRVAEQVGATKDSVQGGLGRLKAGIGAAWRWYTELPQVSSYDVAIGNRWRMREANAADLRQWRKDIYKTVPRKLDREAIVNWMQADGNEEILKHWAENAPHRFRPGYRAALNLSDEHKQVALQASEFFDEMLELLQKEDVLKDGVESYVNQLWKRRPSNVNQILEEYGSGSVTTDPYLTKKRIFRNYFEGEMLGGLPRDKDIAYLVANYYTMANRTLGDRAFLRSLTGAFAKDGMPLVYPSGHGEVIGPAGENASATIFVTPGAKPRARIPVGSYGVADLEQGIREAQEILAKAQSEGDRATALSANHTIKNLQSELDEALESGVRSLPLDNYRKMNHSSFSKHKYVATAPTGGEPVIMKGDFWVHPEAYERLHNTFESPSAIRAHPVGAAMLRLGQEAKSSILSFSGFHQVQEGVHALGHGVNPLNPPPIDTSNSLLHELFENGLTLLSDYGQMSYFTEGAATSGLIHKIPVAGPLLENYSRYLFEDYIPRLKWAMAQNAFERNLTKFGKTYDRRQILRLTAQQANAAFGGQNLEQIGRSATTRDVFRLIGFAPDFLESRMKFFGQSLLPWGTEQRRALSRIALAQAGTAYMAALTFPAIASKFLGRPVEGEYSWRHPFSFVVDGQEYQLRSMPVDILHAFTSPASFVQTRTNPLFVRPAVELVFGRDKWGHVRSYEDQMKDFVTGLMPIPLQEFKNAFGNESGTLLDSARDAAANTLGLHAWRYRSAAEKRAYELTAKLPIIPVSPEDKLRHEAARRIEEASRQGKPPSPADASLLTAASARLHTKKGRMTEFEGRLQGVTIPQLLDLFDLSESENRKDEMQVEADNLIRRIRRRGWKAVPEADRQNVQARYGKILERLAKMKAPVPKEPNG